MKNRFIVLIDFSTYSDHLLRFTYDWSKRIDAEIMLVHNTPIMLPAMTPTEIREKQTAEANSDAKKKLKELAEAVLPRGTPVKCLASEKPLVIQLRQLLKKHYNNLVFLGIKGTGLFKKIFIGSQAVKIIEGIDNLIVAIPQNAPCCSTESIHVAVQKKYPLNIFEFNKFLKFTGEEIKEVTFFSFITHDDDRGTTQKYLKDLSELYSDKRDTSYEIYQKKYELISLKNIIMKKTNELIVIQRGSRMFFDQIFRKFLINELVYEGQTPLVILP